MNNRDSSKPISISRDRAAKYEQMLQHYEINERRLIKRIYLLMTIRDIHDKRLKKYYNMEKEFNEMKGRVKYEQGRLFKEERKENEVIIVRTENAILKKTIAELEGKCDKKDMVIKELNDIIEKLIYISNNNKTRGMTICDKMIKLKKRTVSAQNNKGNNQWKLINKSSPIERLKLNKSKQYNNDISLDDLPNSGMNQGNRLFDLAKRNNVIKSKCNNTKTLSLYLVDLKTPSNKFYQTNRSGQCHNKGLMTKRRGISLSRLALSKSLSSPGMNMSFLNKSNSRGDIDQN